MICRILLVLCLQGSGCAQSSDLFVEPGTDWVLVARGFHLTADSAVDRAGNVYFTDTDHNRIYKLDPQAKLSVWREDSGGAHGIAFGPDGRLYAGQHDRKRLVAFSPDGSETVIAEGVQTHHLTVTARNHVYFAEAPKHRVWVADSGGGIRAAFDQINWPKGLHPTPDQSRLIANDPRTNSVWSFSMKPDGVLVDRKLFCTLHTPNHSVESDAGGMTFDTTGFLYVATALGVQICSPSGQVVATLEPPVAGRGLGDAFFAGTELRWLYVSDGENLFRRRLRRSGAATWKAVK